MATGVGGHHGQVVVQHVGMGKKAEQESVTIQHRNTEELVAMETQFHIQTVTSRDVGWVRNPGLAF